VGGIRQAGRTLRLIECGDGSCGGLGGEVRLRLDLRAKMPRLC
jgi:hypothetical protein